MSNFLIIDLEMCRVPKGIKRQALNIPCEIIQIGAVLVNEKLKIIDTFQTLVKPREGIIDKKIQMLTGISQKDVYSAPDISKVIGDMLTWMPEDTIIVSWSDNDIVQLQRELNIKEFDTTQIERYFETWQDCQRTFSEKMHTEKVYRLSEALAITDIFYDENAHDALVDAQNTAELFIKMATEEELVLSPYYTSSINDIYDTSSSLLGSYTYA